MFPFASMQRKLCWNCDLKRQNRIHSNIEDPDSKSGNTWKYNLESKKILWKHCIYFSFAGKSILPFFSIVNLGKKTYVRRNVAFAIYTGKIHIMFMYTSTTFIPWPFSKIFYGNKCSYLISIMTRIYPCSRYTSISI